MRAKVRYRGPKPLVEEPYQRGMYTVWNWDAGLPYGKVRRGRILDWLKSSADNHIAINKTHCPILKRDPDLKRLLKQGKLKMEKIRSGGKATLSILILNES